MFVATRRAATANAPPGTPMSASDAGMSYRLAFGLNATGQRAEALGVLEPLVSGGVAFPERAEAERLLATLRSAGR